MMINGTWYSETELAAYIATLEHKVKNLENKHLNECRQISEYEAENKVLKDLLEKHEKVFDALCMAIGESGGCDYCPYGKEDPCEVERLNETYSKLTGGKA